MPNSEQRRGAAALEALHWRCCGGCAPTAAGVFRRAGGGCRVIHALLCVAAKSFCFQHYLWERLSRFSIFCTASSRNLSKRLQQLWSTLLRTCCSLLPLSVGKGLVLRAHNAISSIPSCRAHLKSPLESDVLKGSNSGSKRSSEIFDGRIVAL